jgi:benzylsuccinate CoA-transferase BbsF subunit
MEALEGIRVIEISVGQVGPMACELLAFFGAEVIRIESLRKVDVTRTQRDPITQAPKGLDQVPQFNNINLNKLGIRLNMGMPEGVGLAKRLIETSDVLVENFSAGAIDRLGLGYGVVREIKPDIIMASASGSGSSGPEAGMMGFAPIFVYLSGLAEMGGYPDGPPFEGRTSADAINSYTLFFAIMAALWHRQRTGQGQYIDYSSREGLACIIGDSIMDYTMNGRAQSRNGNLDDIMAPHNCYRCRGDDRWVSIAVSSQEEWLALCRAVGHPEWAEEGKFSDAPSRWQNQEELDRLLEAWTLGHTSYEVMDILQKVGVAAVPSFTAEDLYTDPHLAERGLFEVVEHPALGATPVLGCPWSLSASPARIRRPAPLFGEHNDYVFGELLGLSRGEISRLEEARAIW